MPSARIKYLIESSLQQTASEEELNELAYLCELSDNNETVKLLITEGLDSSKPLEDLPAEVAETIRKKIMKGLSPTSGQPSNQWGFLFNRSAAAALIIILAGAGLYMFWNNRAGNNAVSNYKAVTSVASITPGGNRATLTMDDGTIIVLDSIADGQLVKNGDIKVVKLAEGLLSYVQDGNAPTKATGYSTIATPRGGQYMIELPDRTKVWLNAASSIRFPNTFDKNERIVAIKGEAYFEVAKVSTPDMNNVPFKVSCDGIQVDVLGTHFNMMAYPEEKRVQTTLLEGRVMVNKGNDNVTLNPGEQLSIPEAGKPQLQKLSDPEQVIAWKNGQFELNGDIQGIMRQLSRWYDVNVQYDGNVTDKTFGGAIARSENLSEVLKMLELTENIKFKIEGKTVIVSP